MIKLALDKEIKWQDVTIPRLRRFRQRTWSNKKLTEQASLRPDAFALLGLLPAFANTWDEQVSCRLRILHSFQTDLERYAFLLDLEATDVTLFDAVLEQDNKMILILSEMPGFVPELAAVNSGQHAKITARHRNKRGAWNVWKLMTDTLLNRTKIQNEKRERFYLSAHSLKIGKKLLSFFGAVGAQLSGQKWNVPDIIVFGFTLICLASVCGVIPAWISKAGEFVIVIFPVIVIFYLFYFERNEDQL